MFTHYCLSMLQSLRMADELRLTTCTVSEAHRPGLHYAFEVCSVNSDVDIEKQKTGSVLQRGRSAKRLRFVLFVFCFVLI